MILRKFLFAFVMATIGAVGATFIATAAQTADDVFVDEGDGDFATSEMMPSADAGKAEAPAAASAPPPMPELDEYTELAQPEEAPVAAEPPQDATEKAAVEAPKKEKKAEKKAEPKVAKVAAKGRFLTTKQACPMHREAAAGSETMINVKAPRKIWIEEVDSNWVRAFNSAGDPGYVSRDCFQ